MNIEAKVLNITRMYKCIYKLDKQTSLIECSISIIFKYVPKQEGTTESLRESILQRHLPDEGDAQAFTQMQQKPGNWTVAEANTVLKCFWNKTQG